MSNRTQQKLLLTLLCCMLLLPTLPAADAESATVDAIPPESPATTATLPEQPRQALPKIAVFDFTTIDIQGQKFYDFSPQKVYQEQLSLLNANDYQNMNRVMLGETKMLEIMEEMRRRQNERDTVDQRNDQEEQRRNELADKLLKTEQRPVVIGAEYMLAELGKYPDAVQAIDRKNIERAMLAIDFGNASAAREAAIADFGQHTGATHILYATVADFQTKVNTFTGYGVTTSRVTFSLDVLYKLVEIPSGRIVFSGTFTGTDQDLMSEYGEHIDTGRFQTLLKSSVKQAAAALAGVFDPTLRSENAATTLPDVQRIAVAEPTATGEVSAADITGLSNYLESKISGRYTVTSRTALGAILKEYELQKGGLTQENEILELRKGLLKQHQVAALLTYTITKLDNRYIMNLMVVDPITGDVVKGERASIEAANIQGLFRKIDGALVKMNLMSAPDAKSVKMLAVLPTVRGTAPAGVADEWNSKFSAALLHSGSFELLERQNLDAIEQESAMVDFDLADSGQYAKIGALQVADELILTKITRFQKENKTVTTAIAGTASPRYLLRLDVQLKIVELVSGKNIALENVSVTVDTRDIASSERRDYTEEDYNSFLIESAVQKVLKRVLDKLDPILVAAVDVQQVYLTRGSGTELMLNDLLEVYLPGQAVVHPKTGKVLGATERKVAVVKVTSLLDGMSVAEIIQGDPAAILDGAICRFQDDSALNSSKLESNRAAQQVLENTPAPAYPMAQ